MKISYSFWNSKRLIEFFFVGFCIGVIEDIIVVGIIVGIPITWSVIGIIAVISILFAFINEYITDHPFFWHFLFPKVSQKILLKPQYEKKMRYIEFFIAGILFALVENIIVILLLGGEITFDIFIAMSLIAIPFAYFSEIIVDRPDFWNRAYRLFQSFKFW